MRLLIVFSAVIVVCATACTRRVTEEDLFHPRPVVLRDAPDHGRSIEVQRDGGVTLTGWMLSVDAPSIDDKAVAVAVADRVPTLVYFCGNAETVADSMPRLTWLRDQLQVNVMAFDYRGYGASDGTPGLKTCGEDAVAVIAGLRAMRGYEQAPVIVYGRSIGGGMAVYAAAHARIDGLVLEAPPSSCPEVISAWNPNLPWYVRWCITLEPDPALADPELQPITLIPRVLCPLLIMHGGQDTVIPQAQGRELYERAGSANKRFLALPENGHNDLRLDRPLITEALRRLIAQVAQQIQLQGVLVPSSAAP